MKQFLTGDIWKKVNKLFIKREKKTACIAYVTLENLHLSKGDILICDASDYEIKFGATSAKVLNSYFKKGVLIYSKQDLHSKLLLTNSFLAIGSANLSNKSVDTLVESVIVTENNILLSQATAFCNNLKNEATLLTRAHLDRILKIKVVKRPFKPSTKSKTRGIQFGNRFWYVPMVTMGNRVYNRMKDRIDHVEKRVIETTELTEDDVSTYYLRKQTRFTEQARVGDQILVNLRNENKTRRNVYPFATLLRIEKENDETLFVYDNTNNNCFSLSVFTSKVKNLDLEKRLDNVRTKLLSTNDTHKLQTLWN